MTDLTPVAAGKAETEAELSQRDRVLIAANPYSGSGPTRQRVAHLIEVLGRAGLRPRVIWDSAERSATLRDRAGLADCRCIVAAGGDGTVADVINELPPSLPFATLPSGNENLFAREFGFARDGSGLADAILRPQTRRVDLGRASGRLFSLMLSVGFDSAVVHRLVAWRSAGPGLRRVNRLSYARPIAEVLRSYRYQSIQLEADGRRFEGTHAFVFNLPQYGFQFPFAPDARGDDGWLDWFVFGRPGVRAMLDYAWAVMKTKHLRRGDVQRGRAQQVRITANEPMPIQADGEAAGFTPVDITIVPRALRVLIVPSSK